ncbi:alpha/beta fold hydrolase [Jiangella ureilytica]|nr:alpha/beta hydrolase [Jiangella ureilytica]
MPEIERDGTRIHYDDVGSGEALLLMHGGIASAEYWRLAGYTDALAGDFRLLMPDFRGHGRSSLFRDPSRYGIPHDVADVLAVLDAAGVEQATACGWSWGGTVGLALAATHPDRVRGVVAIGSSGRHGRFTDLPAGFGRFADTAARIRAEGLAPAASDVERLGGRAWLRETFLGADAAAIHAWYLGQLTAPPLRRSLAQLRQPVRFIAGEDEVAVLDFPDPLLPPQAELRVLVGENHVSTFLRLDVVVPALRQLASSAPTTPAADVRSG